MEKLFDENYKKLELYKKIGYKNVLIVMMLDQNSFQEAEEYPKMCLTEAEDILREISDRGFSFMPVK